MRRLELFGVSDSSISMALGTSLRLVLVWIGQAIVITFVVVRNQKLVGIGRRVIVDDEYVLLRGYRLLPLPFPFGNKLNLFPGFFEQIGFANLRSGLIPVVRLEKDNFIVRRLIGLSPRRRLLGSSNGIFEDLHHESHGSNLNHIAGPQHRLANTHAIDKRAIGTAKILDRDSRVRANKRTVNAANKFGPNS